MVPSEVAATPTLSQRWLVRTLLLLSLLPVLTGCGLFGNDFILDFTVDVQSVESIQDAAGSRVVCTVTISATAVGTSGQSGTWGESVWVLSSLSTGAELGREARSAAFMGQIFRTTTIEAGATESTSAVERTQDEPFEWHFTFNYRDPDRARQTTEAVATCDL